MSQWRSLLSACVLLTVLLGGAVTRAQVDQGILDLNAIPEATLATLPGFTPAIAQFDKEIGKYVGEKETTRLWRFVVIK